MSRAASRVRLPQHAHIRFRLPKVGIVSFRQFSRPSSTALNGRMPTVHVVDDDPGVQRLIGFLLSRDGFQVRTFSSGWDFLATLPQEMPDVVVLDLMMPEIDGRQVCNKAREQGYEGPVVILSAYEAERAKSELNATAALPKPFEPEVFVERIKEIVSV